MTDSALEQLLGRARGPMGPVIDVDFGSEAGPLAELARMISRMNGFFLFNAGVQVFRVGEEGLGHDMIHWNSEDAWKDTYGGLADDPFCFGQDIFGVQFAVAGGERVVCFDPETAEVTELGDSLESWATWLLAGPDVHGAASFAHAFQREKGALAPSERLVPLRFFVGGGGYDFDNLVVKDAVTAMRIRGPVAQRIHGVPDGTTIRLHVT
ncbi:hypothetical protein [Streptomyces griseorubiginosus]|uniref:SMI1/KNR4 family protein n=1 Tax=Streptomyces griseorubiginosus TaxID=67304 RepID=A0A101SDE4_9ACTN|nr:hypothetical protein [Streptomyces griseorubiginosus]KUN71778.1 hypothetical protein AQJ54_03220 [Streptomyces griseorubiginosus]